MSNLLKTLTAVGGLAIGIAFVSPTHAARTGVGGSMMNGMMGPMMGMMGGGQSSRTMDGCGDMMRGRHQVPNRLRLPCSSPRPPGRPGATGGR